MLAQLSFISLILSCFYLEVQLVHLPLSYHFMLPLILLSYVFLVLFYLFLQRGKNYLLLFHLLSNTLPLSHYIFFLSFQCLDFSK